MKTVRTVLQRAGVDMAALLERQEVITACQKYLDLMPRPVGVTQQFLSLLATRAYAFYASHVCAAAATLVSHGALCHCGMFTYVFLSVCSR